jgi:hypothetical protein
MKMHSLGVMVAQLLFFMLSISSIFRIRTSMLMSELLKNLLTAEIYVVYCSSPICRSAS